MVYRKVHRLRVHTRGAQNEGNATFRVALASREAGAGAFYVYYTYGTEVLSSAGAATQAMKGEECLGSLVIMAVN